MLCADVDNLLGGNIPSVKKKALLVTTKETGLEVNAEKAVHVS
jgi:hypothetical protein